MAITIRTYKVEAAAVFSSTKARFGELSNMAPGFSLFVNDLIIPTSEALYQSCRFPLFPDIQQEIIEQVSPMTAKMVSRKYAKYTRQDWDTVRFDIMRWALKVKLLQNKERFSKVLEETGDLPIVEYSTKDKVWAASPQGDYLVGQNALGRLLMELRETFIKRKQILAYVEPLNIPAFLLYNHPIGTVYSTDKILEGLSQCASDMELV